MTCVATEKEYAVLRHALVDEVAAVARQIHAGTGQPELSPAVLAAMERVPRHRFIPEDERRNAYADRPLSIGHGQTISQPYIVALMTDLLRVGKGDKVLEVGTGSGYQTAILAELGVQVYSIEIVEPLSTHTAALLQELGYDRVQVGVGDGYHGWPEQAPFDAIVVTASASHIPEPLVEQLKPGGRMVIPVGEAFSTQELMLLEKDSNGRAMTRTILPVRFVPLTGGH